MAPPTATATRHELEELDLRAGLAIEAALELFDSLPTVTVPQMFGSWRGYGVDTGNPMDGLLERTGWHGKRFGGPDDVHPLVFDDGKGGLVSVNPALIPMGFFLEHRALRESAAGVRAFRAGLPLMTTAKPRARVRMTEYRGKVSATMCYDALPIHDVFRALDDDTRLGLMDMRGLEQPFVFVLEREPEQQQI